ncbi:DnaJ sub B member 11 [Clonorchis sinensis]|uniref:DnaJ sub B member 11 n=1 Tax=Clonorchis sinensis TaxID=79923 RepID=A0A8T1MEQ3_CLOSI|nr:DnaJ sub B member 11 [Clonorchis sinensis]
MKILPVLVFSIAVAVFAERDYYTILNVKRSADTNEIKRRFRQQAKVLHPDRNKDDPEAERKFQELGEAYEVLSDPEKRKIYDQYGKEGLKRHASGAPHHDPFASFFGFGFDFGGGRGGSEEAARGDDLVVDLWVTLEELYVGDFVEISRVKLDKKNAKGTRKCRCRREMRTTMLGPGQFQMHQVEVCDDCPNVEFYQEERHLELEIEAGMRDGQLYPFVSEGEPHMDGEPGDLKFRVRQQKHRYFQRRGDDLYTNVTLNLVQSLIGYHISITHLDGHQVILKSDKVTPPGTIIHKPGEGMPNYENPRVRGSLYVTFDVAYPENRELSNKEREEISRVFPEFVGFVSSDGAASGLPVMPAQIYNGLDALPRAAHASKVTA